MDSLRKVDEWPAEHVAVAVVAPDGTRLGSHGPQGRPFQLASVTKLLSAYAVLIAVEEGAVEWDQPAGPPGSTVRHLIAHASGLAFDSDAVQAEPGTRRIYSNSGFAVLADTVAKATEMTFADYLHEAVCEPLDMPDTQLLGHPGAGAVSTADDLARFARELQQPRLLDPSTVHEATRRTAFPGLDGVLPGYGRQKPNDWGLGFERRVGKDPHWTGRNSSTETFGHFGQSGTFLWVDPVAGTACVTLTDLAFGEWAIAEWPPFTDAVLAELDGAQ
ncbi:serine hydrolase domain-containing protein [Pseudonocardia eucalypti]|uniref:Serine hydrolase domain-containing protein n=1 Tax=Pseudonocardia eucalypti TaxID=648755 RepID=A0ABP9Q767_9PSEU|nr:CubicO group peptidase (beta-lactamase class C family) [Pseudonocardia eucalypti]